MNMSGMNEKSKKLIEEIELSYLSVVEEEPEAWGIVNYYDVPVKSILEHADLNTFGDILWE